MGIHDDEKRSIPEEEKRSSELSYAPEHHHVELKVKEVDAAAELAAGDYGELDAAEALRIRIQFMDKTTLGSSAILGIRESAHLTTNQYNW
ncbi:hypothetical protein V5O48_014845 [Marasmius crinis-equi]|uniref:Uncharacterized protein n=1 Tax=Marasmius crinis-equi TaxID=585013 RepID=A0ABR3EW58_9AGAR